jgi:hypothetical protein
LWIAKKSNPVVKANKLKFSIGSCERRVEEGEEKARDDRECVEDSKPN